MRAAYTPLVLLLVVLSVLVLLGRILEGLQLVLEGEMHTMISCGAGAVAVVVAGMVEFAG
jgi:hypothetical protein